MVGGSYLAMLSGSMTRVFVGRFPVSRFDLLIVFFLVSCVFVPQHLLIVFVCFGSAFTVDHDV